VEVCDGTSGIIAGGLISYNGRHSRKRDLCVSKFMVNDARQGNLLFLFDVQEFRHCHMQNTCMFRSSRFQTLGETGCRELARREVLWNTIFQCSFGATSHDKPISCLRI
jgi:hypothetical protein